MHSMILSPTNFENSDLNTYARFNQYEHDEFIPGMILSLFHVKQSNRLKQPVIFASALESFFKCIYHVKLHLGIKL